MIVFKNNFVGVYFDLDLKTVHDVTFYCKGGYAVICVEFKDGSTRKWGSVEYLDEYRAEYERIKEYWEYFKDSGYDIDHYELAAKYKRYELQPK